MAILAIQAQNQTLHVALWDGSLREKLVLPLLPDHDQTISREILPWLDRYDLSGEDLQFIVTHGLFSEAWPSGVHVLSETMLDKAVELGSLKLAHSLAAHFGCLAYVVDPASPAEGHPQAFVTGTTEIPRTSRANSYIFKYLVRQEAQRQDLSLAQSRFIVAHICENNQLGALEGTTIVESLTSRDEGAFSLTQSGGLPFDSLVDLCITTADREEVLRILHEKGGFYGYLGSTNIEEVLTDEGEFSALIRSAFVYQIAKEVGALATVLHGDVSSIIIAGDFVQHEAFLQALTKRIEFIAPVSVYGGDQGLEALLAGAERVLTDEPT